MMSTALDCNELDVSVIREQFPILKQKINGIPLTYAVECKKGLPGISPAETQLPA
ncbi:cysteine desulfurase [Yersinia enterocolitica]|uniref:hypothetical protein n=1 Tax=Yersinia enterocolitica TaxID=630 RepID=UPI000309C528|nr:hypothetical protein [Yersinia enterocolitica]AJI81086.1 hypothetical protein CH47_4239 [Yersinia enterocolitica]KGA79887.1 hypothetical protein DJ60_4302 [Yersinia enterocolitica]CFQ21185.1 cysteine desulfurase [Yersinia enterocolitica]CNF78347.1 cysteine desulfurase [Yersinia enterocolitica]CNK41601.1 cysteine desulfurase [Yersinia enterocolitica]